MLEFLTYASYRLLGVLTGPMPPRIGYGLAKGVGRLLYVLSPRLKQVVAHNIRHVLGPKADEEQVQRLARKACVNIVKGHYDLFRLSRLTPSEIAEITQVEGFEHLEQALALGRGVVVITAHFGNVDVVGQLPLAYGIPITGAIYHGQPEALFQHMLQLRQSHGLRLIPSDGPMIGLFRALKRGEIIALPCDRDFADNAQVVKFFDAPARLPDGPVRVALRTDAPLVPAFASRLPDNTFRVEIEPALDLLRTGNLESDVAAGMALVVAAMEQHIGKHPDQWLVAAPVWPME
ncbi:MAG: lysophospholipid acyltransferase family protein [Anaerolineae bacterium]